VPVALSDGAGGFTVVNQILSGFPEWSSYPGVVKLGPGFLNPL
jgi:hypothetical protein